MKKDAASKKNQIGSQTNNQTGEKHNLRKVTAEVIARELRAVADKKKAVDLARFFKTKKGEYGYGDVFIGVVVPKQRIIAKKYFESIELSEVQKLLNSKIHEFRFTALIILVYKYKIVKGEGKSETKNKQKSIFNFYVKNFKAINNWDLVDCTCRDIVGAYLYDDGSSLSEKYLFKLAKSKNLWERRISIISTFYFIGKGETDLTYKLAQYFIDAREPHDLMHKAIGWALREAGKRDGEKLMGFLKQNAKNIPGVTLSYSMERLEVGDRSLIRSLR